MSPWLLLAIAVVTEVIGTIALRFSAGMTRPVPAAVVVVAYGTAFWLLSRIVQQLPTSITYAVWAGAGIALVTAVSVLVLGESLSWAKVVSMMAIVAGVVGLNLSGAAHGAETMPGGSASHPASTPGPDAEERR